MLTSLLSTLGAKIAAGTLIVTAAAGGAAATGNLPPEAQNAVANVAEHVNLELPKPEGHGGDVTDAVFDTGFPPTEDGQDYGENVADVADQDNRDKGDSIANDFKSNGSSVSNTYRP